MKRVTQGIGPTLMPVSLVFLFLVCSISSSHARGAAGPAPAPAAQEDVNVIFISIDTLRHDHLGCYGYERETSGNIDQFSREAVLFENFIGQALLTPLSQMSIFTSQYPRVNGMTSFAVNVEDVTERRLPQILKIYGYTNAAFLSSLEFTLQFKSLAGKLIQTKNLFSQSFDIYEQAAKYEEVPMAMEWIRNNKEKKFFVWISASNVHWPFSMKVPMPYKTRFDGPPLETEFAGILDRKTLSQGIRQSIPYNSILSRIYEGKYYVDFAPLFNLTERDTEYIVSRYDAGIYYTDLALGKLFSLLDELQLADKTLVVLHSIHGEDLGEHGYFNHYDLYDTEVKNALLIRFPESRFGGQRLSTQVQGIDVMPTVLDYLGIPLNHEAMGASLLPLVKDGTTDHASPFAFSTRMPPWEIAVAMVSRNFDRSIFFRSDTEFERLEHGKYMDMLLEYYRDHANDLPFDIAVRTNDWKLILRRNKDLLEKISWWGFITGKNIRLSGIELYDLKTDPLEQENVAQRHPEVVTMLMKKLLEWNDSVEARRAGKSEGIDQESVIPYP